MYHFNFPFSFNNLTFSGVIISYLINKSIASLLNLSPFDLAILEVPEDLSDMEVVFR